MTSERRLVSPATQVTTKPPLLLLSHPLVLFQPPIALFVAEYTDLEGDEELPLGQEFQDHIEVFITKNQRKPEKRYRLLEKLVQQLESVLLLTDS